MAQNLGRISQDGTWDDHWAPCNPLNMNSARNELDTNRAITLTGSLGADRLSGGLQGDQLSGGDGADVLVVVGRHVSLAAAPDTVADFTQGTDHIDLSAFDADWGTDGQPDATFVGHAGERRFVQSAGQTRLQIDTDGTGTAAAVIVLTGTVDLTLDSFVL